MTDQEFEELSRRYDELLERLVKGAKFLENPLIKPEVYEAGMRKFNRLWDEALQVSQKWWNHLFEEGKA